MTTRTADFTGTDGATWPLSSGSWTHTTDVATVSTPTNTIETNRGRSRVAAATTTGAKRSHHADTAGFSESSVRVQIYVESRAGTSGTPDVVLFFHAASTSANSNRYECRFGHDSDGKSGVTLVKIVSGTTTTLYSSTASGGTTTPRYYGARCIKRGSDLLVEFDASASPIVWTALAHSYADSTTGLWDASGGVGVADYYQTDPTAQTTVWYDDFAAVNILPVLPTGIGSTATVGVPTVTSTKTITLTSIASTVALGSPTATPGAVTRSLTGISSTAAVGTLAATPGAITVSILSVNSTLTFGSPTVGSAIVADLYPMTIAIADQSVISVGDDPIATIREPAAVAFR